MIVETAAACGKPVILVVLSGSALALDFAAENIPAVIQGWYPGAQGGKAIAQILFGKACPGGKLPLTFYSENNSLPGFTDYSMKNRTYRYMVEDPLYPFGYGLSYTKFEQTPGELRKNGTPVSGGCVEFEEGDEIEFDVVLKNTGNYTGGVTVQAYVEYGFTDAPVRQLKGLKKLYLAPSEQKKTTIKLDTSSFGLYDKDGTLQLNKGTYTVYFGDSQPDDLSVKLNGRPCDKFTVKVN